MAWFALNCPTIIQLGEESPDGVHFAHLRRVEKSQWLWTYIARAGKLIHRRYDAYNIFPCFPSIPSVGYGEEFHDVGVERSSLG